MCGPQNSLFGQSLTHHTTRPSSQVKQQQYQIRLNISPGLAACLWQQTAQDAIWTRVAGRGQSASLILSWAGWSKWTTVFSSHMEPCPSEQRSLICVCLVSAVYFLFYEVRQCLSVSSLTYFDCCPCRVFGFIARKQGSATDNVCHLFAEHDPEQPASAIVNFVSKVMIGSQKKIWYLAILDSELFADFTEGNHCEREKSYSATMSEYCNSQYGKQRMICVLC